MGFKSKAQANRDSSLGQALSGFGDAMAQSNPNTPLSQRLAQGAMGRFGSFANKKWGDPKDTEMVDSPMPDDMVNDAVKTKLRKMYSA